MVTFLSLECDQSAAPFSEWEKYFAWRYIGRF